MKSATQSKRGFALLVVMVIVAFVGMGAAALLDLVDVDLGIAVEHRKALQAQSASVGAVLESVGQDDFMTLLPPLTDPDLTTRLVARNAGTYQLDPDGTPTTLSAATSGYIDSVGAYGESGYESDVAFLRLMAPEDSSTELPIAIYEVRAKATVSGGDATSQARALIYRHVNKGTDVKNQLHAR